MGGWIKLYRQIEQCSFYFSEPFTRMQAWIDMLLIANHDEKNVFIRGNKVTVHRGEIAYSSDNLAQRWKWSRGKVLRFLDYIEDMGMIVQQKSFVISTISICNYEKYQCNDTADSTADSTADDTADSTADSTADDTADGHKQEVKKKEEKKKSTEKKAFLPPTAIEVADYCNEIGSHIDVGYFMSYYEIKGWKVHGKPMKNWKLTVQTWTAKDRASRPELYKAPEQPKETSKWQTLKSIPKKQQ